MSEKTKVLGDIHLKTIELLDTELKKKNYKQYRAQFSEASNFEKLFIHPIHVDIEVDNICNYACSFCPIGQPESELGEWYKEKKEISVEKIKEILSECKEIGVKSVQLSIVNEPLANKHIFEIIDFASELKFDDLFMVSNASLLNEKNSHKIINSGLTKIQFSLDGFSSETYEKYRFTKNPKPGQYKKVLNNILQFLKIKNDLNKSFPLVKVSFIELEENKHEFKDFKEFWGDKIDAIHYQKLIDYEKKSLELTEEIKKIRCNMPYFRLAIKADGMVRPCCVGFGEKINIGNVYTQSIKEIWNSSLMKKFQQMHQEYKSYENKNCKDCIISTNF